VSTTRFVAEYLPAAAGGAAFPFAGTARPTAAYQRDASTTRLSAVGLAALVAVAAALVPAPRVAQAAFLRVAPPPALTASFFVPQPVATVPAAAPLPGAAYLRSSVAPSTMPEWFALFAPADPAYQFNGVAVPAAAYLRDQAFARLASSWAIQTPIATVPYAASSAAAYLRPQAPTWTAPGWFALFAPADPVAQFTGAPSSPAAYIRDTRALPLAPSFAISQPVASVPPTAMPTWRRDAPSFAQPSLAVAALFAPTDPAYAFTGLPLSIASYLRDARATVLPASYTPPPDAQAFVPLTWTPIAAYRRDGVSVSVVVANAIIAPAAFVPYTPSQAGQQRAQDGPRVSVPRQALFMPPGAVYVFAGQAWRMPTAYVRPPWITPYTFTSAGGALFGDTGPAGSARLAAYQRPAIGSARPSSSSSSRPGSANTRRG
jgi:hypothetical protein